MDIGNRELSREALKPPPKAFSGRMERGAFWFRVFGYGIRAVNRNLHEPLRSERTGAVKVLRLGPWSIKWLRN
jgi:hypothetical protein